MKILGIESSCDETAAAVVENGTRVLSSVVNSQIDLHKVFGGVVPEVAARSHLEVILPVIDRAVLESYLACHPEQREGSERSQTDSSSAPQTDIREKAWSEIDAIACTTMPGLVGSLLIGSLTARSLALAKNLPFFPVHHVEAHVYANFITEEISEKNLTKIRQNSPKFPMLALIVSGGHSQIVLFQNHGNYVLIGQTQDDAVGEAFDKVAKILGLPYPGGPSIARAAETGNPQKYRFSKAKMARKYDFSFSGLKTAVLREVQKSCGQDYTFPSAALSGLLNDAQRADFAASFQNVAIETLVEKICAAYEEFLPKSVVIAGGVAANSLLREKLAEKLPVKIEFPPMKFCTDNAVMVASLGYFEAEISREKSAENLTKSREILMKNSENNFDNNSAKSRKNSENSDENSAKIRDFPFPADPRKTEVFPSISMTKTAWNL